MRRTIYAAKYLADPDYRRKISRQLNKGGATRSRAQRVSSQIGGRFMPDV
ncbi:Tn3 family transposase [Nocardia sp. NPDC051911]